MEDWYDRWKEPGSRIVSEFGTLTPIHKMMDIILDRENSAEQWSESEMTRNGAVLGPRGLYRGVRNEFPLDDATYDLVSGEFS